MTSLTEPKLSPDLERVIPTSGCNCCAIRGNLSKNKISSSLHKHLVHIKGDSLERVPWNFKTSSECQRNFKKCLVVLWGLWFVCIVDRFVYLQTRDSVLMTVEHCDPVALEGVPDVDGVVVIAGEEDSAGRREVDGVHSEQDRLFRVLCNLSIC